MALVSIIVPVYNTEKYLKRCLDSLVRQTMEEIEIVVVDDGSTDSSPEIIESYCKKYPKKFVHLSQKNSGQAAARNRALEICKGEYVGFLDSDDFVKECMFEKMYFGAIKENADYVACGYTDTTLDAGKELELEHYVASNIAKGTKDLFFGALVSPFIHLYKREILQISQVKFPEGKIYEDTAFYLELIPYIKSIVIIEEPLAFRVRHKNSTTATFLPEKAAHIFPVIDHVLEFYREHRFWNEYQEELTYFCVKVLLCSSMQRICKINDCKQRKILIERTTEYLKSRFPNYRKNVYFKQMNALNIYIKSFGKTTVGFYSWMIFIKGKMERKYS